MTPLNLTKNIGFTLLEVIISTALSSLLLLAIYFTYFGINRAVNTASEGQEVLETGRILMELIKQDLRGIVPPPKSEFVGKIEDKEKEGSSHRMDFTTTSAMGGNKFGLSVVGYFIYNIPDKNKKIFIRRESKDIKNELLEGGINYELSKMIISFKLAFYNGEDWVEEWDSRALGKMPKQVRISITVKDENGFSKEFTSDEVIPSAL